MTWFQPRKHCEENCCPVPPCEDNNGPTLTCRRYEVGYGSGGFEYTVEDADVAWITESCGSVITVHMIELTDRAASGVFPVTANCTYCIRARNFCGETFCCDNCNEVFCVLRPASTIGGSPAINPDGSMTFRWEYSTQLFGGDPIVFAELNGVSVLGRPYFETGTVTIPKVDLPVDNVLRLVVRNDCGKETSCQIQLPCCYNKTQLRMSISGMSDFTKSCSATNVSAGGITLNSFYRETAVSGLSSANGTFIFEGINNQSELAQLYNGSCILLGPNNPGFEANRKTLGTVTVTELRNQSVTRPNPFGAGTITTVTSESITVAYTAYWENLALVLVPNSPTATLTQVTNGTTTTTTVNTLGNRSFESNAYQWIGARCVDPWIGAENPTIATGTADLFGATIIQYRIPGFTSNFSIPLTPTNGPSVAISCPQLEFLNMASRELFDYETERL
jgi:hypothetical protein